MSPLFTLAIALLIGVACSQTYDESAAFNALYYSYGSYCDKADIAAWNCKWCLYNDEVSQFQVKDVFQGANWIGLGDDQAFIGYDPVNSRIVIVFRGSSNIDNWMHNLGTYKHILTYTYPYRPTKHKKTDAVQTTYPNIPDADVAKMDIWGPKIHQGFYNIWGDIQSLGMKDSIIEMLTEYPNADILVTGHSLGGALASVCALELKQNPLYTAHAINRVDLITFGAPRWCNVNLAKYFDDVIDSNWRIVYKNDAAPTVPFESMGYHHTATEIWYTNDNPLEYKQCDGSGEDWACFYFGYSVPDHLNYLGLDLESGCSIDAAATTEGAAAELESEDADGTSDNAAELKRAAIMFSVMAAIGWIFAMVFGCCWFKSRKDLLRQQATAPYVEFNDNL